MDLRSHPSTTLYQTGNKRPEKSQKRVRCLFLRIAVEFSANYARARAAGRMKQTACACVDRGSDVQLLSFEEEDSIEFSQFACLFNAFKVSRNSLPACILSAACVCDFFKSCENNSCSIVSHRSSPMALAVLSSQLTTAREHALLGDYASAAVFYAGVLSQVDRWKVRVRLLLQSQAHSLKSNNCAGTCKLSLTLTSCPNGAPAKRRYSLSIVLLRMSSVNRQLLQMMENLPSCQLKGVCRCDPFECSNAITALCLFRACQSCQLSSIVVIVGSDNCWYRFEAQQQTASQQHRMPSRLSTRFQHTCGRTRAKHPALLHVPCVNS